MTIQGDLFMGKTNLKIEYVLKAANNIGFDNIDTYISKIIFEHYNEVPTYTLEKMLSILNVSKPKFKAYLNQIGYKNFTAFKDEIIFEKIVRIKQIRERYDKFEKDKILSVINQLRKSPIDMNDIDGICYEINEHERFIAYGSPTLLNLLFDFQIDMKIFDKTVLLSSVNNEKILNRMWAVGSTESIYSYVNNHTSSYSPALDLYFQHTLPHQQSIQMNVTGTLIHTKNNRKYKEYKDENAPLADIQTLVDGDKRSVIGEAIYEKSFKDVKLSGGARHYQMRTENEYKGSNPTTSKMDQSQTSAFFEVQGKVKDFSYAGSVGMTRAWFKESNEDHAYYTFTPTVRLSYNLKKAGFLRYRFNISPAIPSLGSLTDVEQAIDTIQIVRGNPLLKTYQQFTNSLSYSYSKKQFNANLSVRHQYYDSPIMESIFVEDGKLILKDENQRSFQSLNAELMVGINGATLFGLKDFLTLYASGGYTRNWSEGLTYSHTYDEFYYSVMAQLQYKGFSLLGQFRKVQNNFFGETIKKNENQTAFMAMYAKQNFQAGIGVLFPFTNNYKVGKERISEVAPFRSETFVKETGQMFILRVGYTFEFGRKHKAGNKGLNNSDTDSGIIDMQR